MKKKRLVRSIISLCLLRILKNGTDRSLARQYHRLFGFPIVLLGRILIFGEVALVVFILEREQKKSSTVLSSPGIQSFGDSLPFTHPMLGQQG